MITEEKLAQMKDTAIVQIEMTTKELKGMGFTSHDLTKMVREGQLERVRTGYYVVPAKELYAYGKSLLKTRNIDKAHQCFLASYELEPDNVSTLLRLFYQSIINEKYEDAFKYFDGIFNSSSTNDNNMADNYLFLYLLGYVTDIPDRYKSILASIELSDVELKKKSLMYPNLIEVNRIRKDILEYKFKPSITKLQKMASGRKFSSIRETILRELLTKAAQEKQKNNNLIFSYIAKKDYESLMLTLEAERADKGLSFSYEHLLLLARDYLEIMHTERIPEVPSFGINNTFNAISHRHYKRALELLIQYSEAKSIPVEKDILYQALVDINDLIDSLTIVIDANGQSVIPGFERAIVDEGEQLEIPGFNEKEVTYADVVSSLIGKKKEDADGILTKYFEQKGITQYKFIIDLLLDICILENDLSYSKAMIELANIGSHKYKLDLSYYVQGFYLSLSGSLYDVAEKYLEIIEQANNMVVNKIDTNTLRIALENKKNQKETPTKVESPRKVKIVRATSSLPPNKEKGQTKDVDEELVHSKISVFENGEDVVILKAMNSERRKRIHSIVASIPSVKSFSIGTGSERRIVLTNSPYLATKINKSALFVEGDRAYREQDYEKCIACYRKLLYLVKPNSKVYAKLGLAYMKQNRLKKAIEYLTIATELSKASNNSHDFSELIAKLSGKPLSDEELKPTFDMKEDEFLSEENHYGVQHLEEISRMVFVDGISLEDACKTFNYDENQANIIRLIYAEEYYSAGDYNSGDSLVKLVTAAKNKSKRVKRILDNVNARKKFYKNRPRETSYVYMYK